VLGKGQLLVTKPLDPLEKALRENERLKIDNGQLRAINKKLLRRGGGYAVDDAVDTLREFLATEPSLPVSSPSKIVIPKKPKVKTETPFTHYEHAVTAWSDWHISERIRAVDSMGINEYNSVIAANRFWRVIYKTKKILFNHMAMYPIKKLHIFALGDMINGSIHHELSMTNDLFDPAAVVLAARMMQMGIEELKTLGIPIQVECIVGNHPRITAKMPTKRIAHLSLDWAVYEIVANYFRNDDQVTINVHTGPMEAVDILGWRYLIEHGIDVKSGGEENLEDRIRGLLDDATYRQAVGLSGPSFDQIVIGNMHKIKSLERVRVNGCLTGQNELGVSWRLKTIKAMQWLWGVSEEHVSTFEYKLDVTPIRDSKKDRNNPFGEYTADYMRKHSRV
jgi:hypothetical protein